MRLTELLCRALDWTVPTGGPRNVAVVVVVGIVVSSPVILTGPIASGGEGTSGVVSAQRGGSVLIDSNDTEPAVGTELSPGERVTFQLVIQYQLPAGATGSVEIYFPDAGGRADTVEVTGSGETQRLTRSFQREIPSGSSVADGFGVSVILRSSDGDFVAGDDTSYPVAAEGSRPAIESASPAGGVAEVSVGDSIDFSVEATDPDGDELTYTWSVDFLGDSAGFEEVSSGSSASYSHSFEQAGDYVVRVDASDGSNAVRETWTVGVMEERTTEANPGNAVDGNESTVRSGALSTIKSNEGFYRETRNYHLNSSWWNDRSSDTYQEAIEHISPNYGEATLTILTAILGGGSHASSLITITKVGVTAWVSLREARIASLVGSNGNEDIRTDLRRLEENTRSIRTRQDIDGDGSFTDSDLRALLQQREKILRSIYGKLNPYAATVDARARRCGLSFGNACAAPSEQQGGWGEAQLQVRNIVAQLRSVLIVDYYMTTSWLKNKPSKEHLAIKSGSPPMPHSRLTVTQPYGIVIDTLDTPSDHAIYELEVDQAVADRRDGLRIVVKSQNASTIEAWAKKGAAPSPESLSSDPSVHRLATTDNETNEITFPSQAGADLQQGSYFVLVEGNVGGFYAVGAQTTKRGLLSSPERIRPSLLDSPPIREYPDPEIEHIRLSPDDQVPANEELTINVSASNVGGPADGQTIAVSFPNLTDKSSIEILDHNLDAVRSAGAGTVINGKYGSEESVSLAYPLVEGEASEWVRGERKYLKLRVVPERAQRFDINVKSVARQSEVWLSEPTITEAIHVDQQNEYVEVRSVTVVAAGSQNEASTAVFDIDPETPVVNSPVQFDATRSTDSDGSIAAYEWDFDGDGTADASGERVTHTFSDLGEQTVTLTVTDDAGATNQTARTIVVEPVDDGNSPPVARLQANPTTIGSNDTVTLDASESTDPDGDDLTYQWAVVTAPEGTGVELPDGPSG